MTEKKGKKILGDKNIRKGEGVKKKYDGKRRKWFFGYSDDTFPLNSIFLIAPI